MTLIHLRPCHVTGMHTPDHHLTSETVCGQQMADIAEQALAGRTAPAGTAPADLPRELHPDCTWCGTAPKIPGKHWAKADRHAAWVAAGPNQPTAAETLLVTATRAVEVRRERWLSMRDDVCRYLAEATWSYAAGVRDGLLVATGGELDETSTANLGRLTQDGGAR